MVLTELARLGDKIDIQLVQQLQMQDRGELDGPIRTYKSSVFDYISDTEVEIAMPTENGRMVLFQVGLRCKLLFYTKRGMYTCTAAVQKRYKKDSFFVLAMQITSQPVKFQRREFYRLDCMIEIRYVPVPREIVDFPSTEAVFMEIQKPEYIEQFRHAITLDLSGGGMRFTTAERLEEGSYLVAEIQLSNDQMDQMFYLITRVLISEPQKNSPDRFVSRGQFMFKNLRDREKIVRFIFEEERRLRRKEMG